VPWAQRLLNPASVWPLTTGRGVLVAVLGTGVDRTNAQFGADQVADGTDVAGPGFPSTMDCDGRGTFAAGLIAARADPRTTFVGLAPGVRVLPVRYVQATRGGTGTVDPDLLAKAIQAAVQAHAGVICVVVPAATDSPKLRDAVAAAHAADALVVSPATAGQNAGAGASGVSYPTATPGVLAVGAVGQGGAAVSAESGGYLALAAPGQRLVSTAPGTGGGLGHIGPIDDVAFAAAFVAGTAALVRAYRPGLTADQVATRLERTADHPAAAGGRDPHLGWGMVNPYAAVATEGADASASAVAARTVAAARPAAATGGSGRRAAGLALILVTLAGVVALGAVVRRRGRARGWRSGAAS
jgi:hypothetical protein